MGLSRCIYLELNRKNLSGAVYFNPFRFLHYFFRPFRRRKVKKSKISLLRQACRSAAEYLGKAILKNQGASLGRSKNAALPGPGPG